MIPRRVSGRLTQAADEKTRKWVARASSRPPPWASPATAEILGTLRLAMVSKVERRAVTNSAVLLIEEEISTVMNAGEWRRILMESDGRGPRVEST